MADHSKIEWTEATWNPVTGCTKVSAGCKHCYALREWPRLSANPKTIYFGREFGDVQCHGDRLIDPLRWTRPRRVFVNSMSDLFHEAVPDAFIDRVFAVMALSQQHTFQVLTKRAERMKSYMVSLTFNQQHQQRIADAAEAMGYAIGPQLEPIHLGRLQKAVSTIQANKAAVASADHLRQSLLQTLPNVWLGVSVEDQASANERMPYLLQTPTAVRWVSMEPLVGPVSFRWATWVDHDALKEERGRVWHLDGLEGIHWVVVGGESGPKARPMHPNWVRAIRDQCQEAAVPFFFKQWGEWVPRSSCYHTFEDGRSCADIDPDATRWPCLRMTELGNDGHNLAHEGEGDSAYVQRTGKKIAGRLLDGVLHDAYPAERAE